MKTNKVHLFLPEKEVEILVEFESQGVTVRAINNVKGTLIDETHMFFENLITEEGVSLDALVIPEE